MSLALEPDVATASGAQRLLAVLRDPLFHPALDTLWSFVVCARRLAGRPLTRLRFFRMNNTQHFVLVSLGLIALLPASAAEPVSRTGWYAEAGPAVGFFGDDFKSVAGGSLGLGYRLKADRVVEHSVELEVSTFRSETRNWWRFNQKVTFTPLLAKYKAEFPLGQARQWSLFVAPAIGTMFEKHPWVKDTAFAGGGEFGGAFRATENVHIALSGTSLYMSGTDITTKGSVGMLHLRLQYKF